MVILKHIKTKRENENQLSANKEEEISSKSKKNSSKLKKLCPLDLLEKHIDLITKNEPTSDKSANLVQNEITKANHWNNLSKRVPFVVPWEMLFTENALPETYLTDFNVYKDENKEKKKLLLKVTDLIRKPSEKMLKQLMSDTQFREFYKKVKKIIGPISVRLPIANKPKIPFADMHEEENSVDKSQVIIVNHKVPDDNWALVPYTGKGSVERLEGGACNDPDCCPLPCCQASKPDLIPLTELFPTEPKQCQSPTFGDGPFVNTKLIDCIHPKKETIIPTSLGSPVGIVRSTIIITENEPSSQITRFASYLKSMALIYLKEICYVQSKDLDKLISEGEDLLQKAILDPMDEPYPEVYSEIESKVQRNFVYENYKFSIELESGKWKENIKDNLYNALKNFFIHMEYCLIQIQHWYLLIWKERNKYFVLDLNGRERNLLLSNKTGPNNKNVLVLLCLKSLINVAHLIVNMSDLKGDELFLIRRILYAEVISPKGRRIMFDFGVRRPEFQMINDNYSYLLSNLHLTLNPAVPVRNRSALPVGIAAMIASKIDHPATWNMKMVDKIICFGVNLCRSCWKPCVNLNEPINLNTFPTCMHIGQFLAGFELESNVYEGTWKCRPISLYSNFRAIIELAFSRDDHLLFQINNQMYAMWKKNGFYYLLDPYLHYISGKFDEYGKNKDYTKSASLRMFRNIDILLKVFNDILLQSNRTAKFHLHTLKINSLIKCNECKEPVAMPVEEDVKSLNEYICFEEDYSDCLDELGQISDYEEDVESYMTPIGSVTSSLTEIEEEEGGSDLSGYATASSGRNRHGWGSSRGLGKSSGFMGDGKDGYGTDGHGKDGDGRDGDGKDGDGKDGDGKDGDGKDGDGKDGDGKDGDGKDGDGKDGDGKDGDGKDGDGDGKGRGGKHGDGKKGKSGSKSAGKGSQSGRGETDTQLKGLARQSSDYVPKKKKRCSSSDDYTRPDPFMSSPCYSKHAKNMIIARSCSGTYDSICKKLNAGLRCCDRVLLMTPLGNFAVFRGHDYMEDLFFVYDGCTCHIERFRHMDLSCGTVGLLPFNSLHCVICYMLSRERLVPKCDIRAHFDTTDNICNMCTPCQNFC